METSNRFRQCLHPTPFGFALGILVMAFSIALWAWFFAQVGGSPQISKRDLRSPSMAWSAAHTGRPRALTAGSRPPSSSPTGTTSRTSPSRPR
jgi:hypothetical protein